MAELTRSGEASPIDEELRELARSLTHVLNAVHRLASREERTSEFTDRVTAHLGVDAKGLPVVTQELPPYQLIDV